jgi:hypothetical protein
MLPSHFSALLQVRSGYVKSWSVRKRLVLWHLCYNRVMAIIRLWLGSRKAPPCQWNVDIELNIPGRCVLHLLDRTKVLCNFCLRWLNGFRCFPLGWQVAATVITLHRRLWRCPSAPDWSVPSQPHRHLWTDCLDNVGSSTSHNPIGLHGLL